MRRRLTLAIAFGVTLLLPNPSNAFCTHSAADSRLQVYCLSNLLSGTATDLQGAQTLDYRIKQEGYTRGIGLPGQVEQVSFSPYISPILEYNSDINGGNPDRPLVLGSLVFSGDDRFIRKDGVIAGLGIGGAGRVLYGAGKYLDYSLGASYAHSPTHDIGIIRGFANICSKNDIGRNLYLDGCLSTSRLNRELADEKSSSAAFSISKLFSESEKRFSMASLGIRRLFDEEYEQNQIVAKLDTLHDRGFHTGINVSFGEAVSNTLTMRHSVSATVGTMLFDRQISATFAYSYSEGGQLLGFARDETTKLVSVTYAVHPSFRISVGYRDTSSSIDYFNESESIIGVQFSPIRF